MTKNKCSICKNTTGLSIISNLYLKGFEDILCDSCRNSIRNHLQELRKVALEVELSLQLRFKAELEFLGR